MEIQSIIELHEAKNFIFHYEKIKEIRDLTEDERLEFEQLKDDVEYFEEFIL
jgi:hypothetical protein